MCALNESSVEVFGYTVLGRRIWGSCFEDDAFAVEVVLEFAKNKFPGIVDMENFEGIILLSNEKVMEILERSD